MTGLKANQQQKRQRSILRLPSAGQLTFGFFSLFCLLLLLRNAAVAVEYVNRGLLLCARSVIPSLFPFMVISEILVNGGTVNRLPRWLLAPIRSLLGLPDAGCCAVLLGLVCGFPVGAKCAVSAYENGALTKGQAERVVLISCTPSSAFLIGTVGGTMWENPRFGTALYATVIGVSLLTGIVANLLCKERSSLPEAGKKAELPMMSRSRGAALFTEAIRSSTVSMLLVCAYVIFFSALLGTLHYVLAAFSTSPMTGAVLFCLFELSGGVSQAAGIGNAMWGAALTAFAVGWSGLSVHCQLLSVCDGKGLSFRAYFPVKLLQGFLCALLFLLLLHLFPTLLIPAKICLG